MDRINNIAMPIIFFEYTIVAFLFYDLIIEFPDNHRTEQSGRL